MRFSSDGTSRHLHALKSLFLFWIKRKSKKEQSLFLTFLSPPCLRAGSRKGLNVIKQMPLLLVRLNPLLTWVITGENKPGFIRGMIDTLKEAGGQSYQTGPLKHAPYPSEEIGFQLQAQGSSTEVTPQSARVRAKAALQAGLTLSINSPSLTHNTNLSR